MIRLAEVAAAFLPQLEAQYSERLLPGHRHALSAILHCRTEESGTAAILQRKPFCGDRIARLRLNGILGYSEDTIFPVGRPHGCSLQRRQA